MRYGSVASLAILKAVDFLWWSEVSPWLQGLFGGAGATLLWELVLKPARDRRSLAHMLAAEVQLLLQAAAAHRLLLNKNPRGLPADFALPDQVFKSTAPRIGQLPGLANAIVLLYHRAAVLNRGPERWSKALDEYKAIVGEGAIAADRRRGAQKQLDIALDAYRSGLDKLVETANEILPELRSAARPWYRIDLLIREKRVLTLEELDERVSAVYDARMRASGDSTG